MSEKSPSMKLVKKKMASPKVTSDLDENTSAPASAKTKTAAPVEKEAEQEQLVTTSESIEDEKEDLIARIAKEVENLTENKAWKSLPQLLDGIDNNLFKLGGFLAKIQSEGWYLTKGYENFRGFVESEANMEYRKAMYVIGIYNGLVESGVSWSQVGHLGWTKLKELASILTPENVDEYVSVAQDMTVLQLIAYLKDQKKAATNEASDTNVDESKKVSTMTFKLYEDQKATVKEGIDKCMKEMNTTHTGVALEHIILDYLSGDKKVKKMPTLEAIMKTKSAEEVLGIFGEVFPDVAITATM